jgi:amino-acid N-acetyltransferase
VIGLEVLGKFALLRSLAVPARFPGQGNASQLTEQAEEFARSREVEALNLLTTMAEDFFGKRGYHRVDRDTLPAAVQETAEFQSLCPSIAVCMHKYLNAVENFDSKRWIECRMKGWNH